jgi:hypothetical protein
VHFLAADASSYITGYVWSDRGTQRPTSRLTRRWAAKYREIVLLQPVHFAVADLTEKAAVAGAGECPFAVDTPLRTAPSGATASRALAW